MQADGGPGGLPEVDVLLKGLMAQPGVEGFLVFNDAAVPVKWTNAGFIKPGTPNSANPLPPQIVHNTALFSDLADKARATCRRLLGDGGDGELTSMRLHTRTSEIVLAPAHECTLVVVQRAHSAENTTLVALAEKAQMQAIEDASKQPGGKK